VKPGRAREKAMSNANGEFVSVLLTHLFFFFLSVLSLPLCSEQATNTITKHSKRPENVKVKVWTLCCSATYMSQTRDQQRFTISEVAADWHKPMVLQRIMWPSIARANGQLDPRCS